MFIGIVILVNSSFCAQENRSVFALYNKANPYIEIGDEIIKTVYCGAVKLSPAVSEQYHAIPMYYKGRAVQVDKDGSFTLTEQLRSQTFSIVITTLLTVPTANTIEELRVPQEVAYVCFNLLRVAVVDKETKGQETWHIEKRVGKGEFAIPRNALIVLFEPDLVEDMMTTSWKKDGNFLVLPDIVCKKSMSKKQFEKAYNHAQFVSLDFKLFHPKEEYVVEQYEKKRVFKI